jgi:hypothetical protein
MSSIYTKYRFVFVQLLILIGMGVLLLIGDHSQPKILSVSSQLSSTDPVLISFDRPLKQSEGASVLLTHGDTTVKGSISWSSREIAFIPAQPLAYDTTYDLKISGVTDLEGHAQRSSYTSLITTSPSQFVYMTPEHQLRLYTLKTKSAVDLTVADLFVVSYALSSDGKQIAVSGYSKKDEALYEFDILSIDRTGVLKRTVLSRGIDQFYDVRICNNNRTIFSSRMEYKNKQLVDTFLYAFDLAGENTTLKGAKNILNSSEIPSPDTLVCSQQTDQFLYFNGQGGIVLANLEDPHGYVVGVYQDLYGFSPKDDQILVSSISSTAFPIARQVYSINDKSVRTLLSNPLFDSTEPAFNQDESVLALSEDPEFISADADPNHFVIVLYKKGYGVTNRKPLATIQPTTTDQAPRWSRDGRYVSFERVVIDSPKLARPQDIAGHYIDGDIWLATIPDQVDLLRSTVSLEKLPIQGSKVQWLP